MFDDLVLDTHALIWFIQSDPRLGIQAEKALREPGTHIVIPALALAEACFLVERHRTAIPSPADLFRILSGIRNARFAALNSATVRRGASLSKIRELHDRQIVATALRLVDRGHRAAVVTKDANITASGLVPVIW